MKPMDEIILKFFQKEALPDETKELDSWSNDPANRKELNDYSKLWLWSHQLKDRAPQVKFEETWNRIGSRKNTAKSRVFRIGNLLKYAAAVLLVLNAGWWGSHLYYQLNEDAGQPLQVSADLASNSVLVLPDNTVVHLRQGSVLRYNPKFNARNREVSLEGEAYFNVTSDPKHPFTVNTENAAIRVLGTRFNVLAEKGSPVCQTTLVEGKVELIAENGKRYLLLPNQTIELNAENKEVKIKRVNTELYTAWKDGKIIFRDETLGGIAKKLERIYHVKFVFANSELADKHRFSGTFYRETSVGDVITMLKLSIPMTVTRNEKFPDPDIIYLK